MPCTNALGYFVTPSAAKKKSKATLTPWPNVIKLFTAVIYECSLKARMLVPGKIFHTSIMFTSKAKSFPKRG